MSFEEVADLVGARRVLVRAGWAVVPREMLGSQVRRCACRTRACRVFSPALCFWSQSCVGLFICDCEQFDVILKSTIF